MNQPREPHDVHSAVSIVEAGGEYWLRPDRIGIWIALWIAVAAAFGGTSILGLAYNGVSAPGLAIALAATCGPAVAVASALLVTRNSGHRLTKTSLYRRDWLGKTKALFAITEIVTANFIPGRTGTSWCELGGGWIEFEVAHPARYPGRGVKYWYLPSTTIADDNQTELSAWLPWSSEQRVRDFLEVFRAIKSIVGPA